jgi:hypothetical protein
MRRLLPLAAVLLVVAILWPTASLADVHDPRLIDCSLLMTGQVEPGVAQQYVMLQVTSWGGSPYRYVVTLGNFSEFDLRSTRLLNRYFPADPNAPELTEEWFAEELEPGESASHTFTYDQAWPDGCHQLELQIADGLGSIVMDCSPPNSTTVFQLPLGDDITAYLMEPPLTAEEPDGPSKLGIHVTRNSTPEIMAFVRDARPAVLVGLGDVGWLGEAKSISPETITIARYAEPNQSLQGDPIIRAREFVASHLERYLLNPGVDYWLGWNEPVLQTPEDMAWYAAFEAERTIAMAEHGLKVAIGNFSVGTPEAHVFGGFLPAIRAAMEHGGVLSLHEYGAPTMRDGVGAGIPGADPVDGAGALTLRYRYWYNHFLQPNDLVIPLVITEAGIDGGVLVLGNDGEDGWRGLVDLAVPDKSISRAAASYLEQLSWYDDELRRDPYVLGFAVFNVGDQDGKWRSFDMTDLLPQLAHTVLSKP